MVPSEPQQIIPSTVHPSGVVPQAPIRPPRRRPIQASPPPTLMVPGSMRRPSYHRTNRYIPSSSSDNLINHHRIRSSSDNNHMNFNASSRDVVQLYPENKIEQDQTCKINKLPKIILVPPTPKVVDTIENEKLMEICESSSNGGRWIDLMKSFANSF
ncbi:hypothetical protein CROQUDRAFT_102747 [Cronartium quercuum f. sp. fusiforme G11]|uniref:Uncharacterized protein n=1 Tax=Cronartium quercuum f. sp. fusiforme G11 TaxID=708437 RepID=A0A9P6N4M0_9BASI|nr:hypothetical protein CROQUDRAFT_102747 [Cronartium quercuum f. sp. fusiforme G11]